ncbi:YhfC family intramembrane metalloprotease [Burkholderia ubonensis]|uniref:YhfC family intramembrane metalloprotease n=1 Tax=Burkholderia ubonensis TaxID=101571 RepID=UPI001E39C601|nr:YhfC family glutamic-type intramembrane protease [Burkholderia ubonensis]
MPYTVRQSRPNPLAMPVNPIASSLVLVTFVAGLVALIAPPVMAIAWRRRTHVPLRAFFCGMLIFFVFQPVLRMSWLIPLSQGLGRDPHWRVPFLVMAAFTAGLFEECGRWVAFRYLLRTQRNPKAAVMYGLGHGGLEAMLLVGVGFLALSVGYALAAHGLMTRAPLLALIDAQFGNMTLASPLLALVERASAMAVHVGLSLIVLRSFVGGGKRWLAVAIALHFVLDLLVVFLARYWNVDTVLIEGMLVVCAAIVLWFGVRCSRMPNGGAGSLKRDMAL